MLDVEAEDRPVEGWTPVVEDAAFNDLLRPGAVLRRLATGAVWSEGPVWLPRDGSVIWSDIPNNRVLRWHATDGATVLLDAAEYQNGHALDHDGSILACSHGRRRIERLAADMTVSPVVERWLGRRFNSPNDLVVRSDGSIWFTDPPYGIISDYEGHKADSEIGDNLVFRFDPVTGELDAVTDRVEAPNGLAFSPDKSILYVSDTSSAMLVTDGSGKRHILAFDVVDGRRLANPRVFYALNAALGVPDGFRVDVHGQRVDLRPGWDPRRGARRPSARPAPGPGADLELRLRRPRAGPAVCHGEHVALCDRRLGPRSGPARPTMISRTTARD